MKRFWLIALISVLAAGIFTTAYSESGRESKYQSPQQTDIKYASEEYAYSMRDIDGVVRFEVLPSGEIVVYNASGATVFAIDTNGSNTVALGYDIVTPTFTTGVGYNMTEAVLRGGNYFLINTGQDTTADNIVGACAPTSTGNDGVGPMDGSGVTVVLATPTAAMDGKVYTFINNQSGGTEYFLYAPGDTISGVSPMCWTCNRTVGEANVSGNTDFATLDGFRDMIRVMAMYNSAVSWEVLNYRNWTR